MLTGKRPDYPPFEWVQDFIRRRNNLDSGWFVRRMRWVGKRDGSLEVTIGSGPVSRSVTLSREDVTAIRKGD